MAEIEKRLEVVEEGMGQRRVVESAILDIVEKIDRKMDEQDVTLQQHNIKLDIIRRRLDEQEVTLAEHSQLLRTLAQGQQQIVKLLSQPKSE